MFRVTFVQHNAPVKVKRFDSEADAVNFRRTMVAGGATDAIVWRGAERLEG